MLNFVPVFVPVLEVRVELLTRAHDCFTLSCNMEGISDVLQAARLCNVRLVESKSYSLMVSKWFFSFQFFWCMQRLLLV